MILKNLLKKALGILSAAGIETAWLDACVIVAHVLRRDKLWLMLNPEYDLIDFELAEVLACLDRRVAGESVAYLRGFREFWGRDFLLGPGVLVPRPETEILVEWVLNDHPLGIQLELRDICTGTGAIVLSIWSERPDWTFSASDLSADALKWAVSNRSAQGAQNSVTLIQSDLLNDLLTTRHLLDIITANPPYVPEAETHKKLEAGWLEPELALNGGVDGLDVVRRIAEQAFQVLRSGGKIYLEFGDRQSEAVLRLFENYGFINLEFRSDYAGIPRVIRAQKP